LVEDGSCEVTVLENGIGQIRFREIRFLELAFHKPDSLELELVKNSEIQQAGFEAEFQQELVAIIEVQAQ
jgi:hypothetical protein